MSSRSAVRLKNFDIVFELEPALHGARHAARCASFAVYVVHRPCARKAVHDKNFIGCQDIRPRERRHDARHAVTPRGIDHPVARHTGHAAAVELWRGKSAVGDDEDVGHGTGDHVSLAIAEYAFGNARVGPFGARKHVLESVEVLYPRERGLWTEAQRTPPDFHAVRPTLLRVRRDRSRGHDASCLLVTTV